MIVLGYYIDLRFINAPAVRVDLLGDDEKPFQLTFTDDDARSIVPMKSNPAKGGTGTVVDLTKGLDMARMEQLVMARVDEATRMPESIAARVAVAEAARMAQRDAEEAKARAEAEEATLRKTIDALKKEAAAAEEK